MANYIRPEAVVDLARRLATRISPLSARHRMAHLFAQALRDDARNARPITLSEAIAAPDWVRRALASREPVHAFDPHPVALHDLRTAARLVRAASAELAYLTSLPASKRDGRADHILLEAADLFKKMERMPLAAIVIKARSLANERARRQRAGNRARALFERVEVYAAPGRVWRRVVSVAELAEVGARLHNCLAGGSDRHADYARQLRTEASIFWTLCDQADTPLAIAKVDRASGRITEAGGPFNAKLSHDDALIDVLVRARELERPTGTERWAVQPQPAARPAPPPRRSPIDYLSDAELAALVESIIGQRPQGVLRR